MKGRIVVQDLRSSLIQVPDRQGWVLVQDHLGIPVQCLDRLSFQVLFLDRLIFQVQVIDRLSLQVQVIDHPTFQILFLDRRSFHFQVLDRLGFHHHHPEYLDFQARKHPAFLLLVRDIQVQLLRLIRMPSAVTLLIYINHLSLTGKARKTMEIDSIFDIYVLQNSTLE